MYIYIYIYIYIDFSYILIFQTGGKSFGGFLILEERFGKEKRSLKETFFDRRE